MTTKLRIDFSIKVKTDIGALHFEKRYEEEEIEVWECADPDVKNIAKISSKEKITEGAFNYRVLQWLGKNVGKVTQAKEWYQD